jgi:hypothetical protein
VASPEHLTLAAEQLLASHIDSVGALDLLLLLHGRRDRDWSAAELCETLRCPDAWAVEQLSRLCAVELVSGGSDGRYRYVDGREYGASVDAIAHACRHDRASVTRRIFARPGSQFAR